MRLEHMYQSDDEVHDPNNEGSDVYQWYPTKKMDVNYGQTEEDILKLPEGKLAIYSLYLKVNFIFNI